MIGIIHKQIKNYNANFHNDGFFDTDVREVPSFQKNTKAFGKEIFSHPSRSTWIHVFQKYFLNYVYLKDMYYNFERNWNNSGCIKVENFHKSLNF